MAKPDLVVHRERMPQMSQCCGLPVREDVLFSNKNGQDKPALHKAAEKTLARLADPLKHLLQPGEVILYCGRAQSPLSAFEQFFTGWWSQVMTRVTLVITNRRLFQFSATMNGAWKRSLSAVSWGDVAKVKTSRFLGARFLVTYKNGISTDYWGVKFGDAPKLQALANALVADSAADATAARSPVSLCPDCWGELTPRVYQCGKCGLVFKNEKTLIKMGVFVPGGAYFYTGFPVPGVLTAFGELIVLFEVVIMVIAAFVALGKPEFGGYVGALAIFALLYAFETLVTIMHNRRIIRQFVPTGKKQAAMPMASSSAAAGKGF